MVISVPVFLVVRLSQQKLETVTVSAPTDGSRLTSSATVVCDFRGDNVNLEYIAWTKITGSGERQFVFSYNPCTDENASFGDLYGRATTDVIEPIGSNGFAPDVPDLDDVADPKSIARGVESENDVGTKEEEEQEEEEEDAFMATSLKEKSSVRYHSVAGRTVKVGGGRAALLITSVKLSDEAQYECLVKANGGPALSDVTQLSVFGRCS